MYHVICQSNLSKNGTLTFPYGNVNYCFFKVNLKKCSKKENKKNMCRVSQSFQWSWLPLFTTPDTLCRPVVLQKASIYFLRGPFEKMCFENIFWSFKFFKAVRKITIYLKRFLLLVRRNIFCLIPLKIVFSEWTRFVIL